MGALLPPLLPVHLPLLPVHLPLDLPVHLRSPQKHHHWMDLDPIQFLDFATQLFGMSKMLAAENLAAKIKTIH